MAHTFYRDAHSTRYCKKLSLGSTVPNGGYRLLSLGSSTILSMFASLTVFAFRTPLEQVRKSFSILGNTLHLSNAGAFSVEVQSTGSGDSLPQFTLEGSARDKLC